MTEDSNVNVRISGRTLYAAIRNYMRNDQAIKDRIEKMLDTAIPEGTFKALVRERLEKNWYADNLRGFVQQEIRAEVKQQVAALVTALNARGTT